jgi:deazaflavin-dependent oxidoreductase (nitroreductase family)
MSNPFDAWNQPVIDEFRANDGSVSHGFGRALVLLHHVGAKSGIERVSPVMGIRQGADTWFVAASKGGAPENPAWYHNLLAHAETTIETPDEGVVAVRAEELTGAARDAAWESFTARSDGFRQYQEKTTRVIPVIALHRL